MVHMLKLQTRMQMRSSISDNVRYWGVDQDYSAAMKWKRMAANKEKQSAVQSQAHVLQGQGVASYSAAMKWYQWLQTKDVQKRSLISGSVR